MDSSSPEHSECAGGFEKNVFPGFFLLVLVANSDDTFFVLPMTKDRRELPPHPHYTPPQCTRWDKNGGNMFFRFMQSIEAFIVFGVCQMTVVLRSEIKLPEVIGSRDLLLRKFDF